MFDRQKSSIEKKEQLYAAQYGFREKSSAQHAILDIMNSIQMNFDKKIFSRGIAIDLTKA